MEEDENTLVLERHFVREECGIVTQRASGLSSAPPLQQETEHWSHGPNSPTKMVPFDERISVSAPSPRPSLSIGLIRQTAEKTDSV